MSNNLDDSAVRAYRDALTRVGRTVTLQRVTGTAPRTFSFSADVQAVVRDYQSFPQGAQRTGRSENDPGGITQGLRHVIVLAADLQAKRFPLPVRKNDKLILNGGDKLTVVEVDAEKRSIAGAIELTLAGVP